MTDKPDSSDPHDRPFWRATAVVYVFLVTEVCFLLAAAPAFVGLLLLDRSASNIPLYALAVVPLGPAFSAALSTLHLRARTGEGSTWVRYWRSYVQNVFDVLRLWIPALAVAAVLGLTIAFGPSAGVDGFFVGAAIVFLIVLSVWAAHAIMIASLFRFRSRDVARLALYYLAAKPLASLGALSCLVLVAAAIAFTTDVVAALLAVLFAMLALAGSRGMVTDIDTRFVAGAESG